MSGDYQSSIDSWSSHGRRLWDGRWLSTGFAFGDFLFNLVPMASEAQYSDGARLWQMYRRGPWCDFHCANHYMGLSQTTALRPRDWPTAMVERAAEFAASFPNPPDRSPWPTPIILDRGDWQRGAVVAGKGASGRSARAAGWPGAHVSTGRSWKHSIGGTAGKPSVGSRRPPSGTIRSIIGARPPRSGQSQGDLSGRPEGLEQGLGDGRKSGQRGSI